jgi:hypothetical protein
MEKDRLWAILIGVGHFSEVSLEDSQRIFGLDNPTLWMIRHCGGCELEMPPPFHFMVFHVITMSKKLIHLWRVFRDESGDHPYNPVPIASLNIDEIRGIRSHKYTEEEAHREGLYKKISFIVQDKNLSTEILAEYQR